MKTPTPHLPRALASLVAAAALWVAPHASALTLEGRVLLGDENRPVSGHSVQIHVVKGMEELPGGTEKTDARGRFRFTGLKSEEGLSYYLATEYQGAFYTEGPIPSSGDRAERDLVVYEVDDDTTHVAVSNQHVILERQPDGLHVTEVLVFQNSGPKAFLGKGLVPGEHAGVRLGLPPSVKDFQIGMGGDPATTSINGRELVNRRPIPPGMRPFSFTYHLALSGRADFSHRLNFPTETFVVMIDDPKLKLESKQLESSGTREQGGKTYRIYTGSGFKAGEEVAISVQEPSFWTNPAIYPWLAAPAVVVLVLWLALRRGRRAQAVATTAREHEAQAGKVVPIPAGHAPGAGPASAAAPAADAAPDEFAQVYLYLISALDQASSKGEVPKEASELIRRSLKRKLEVVLSNGTARAKS